MKRQWRLLACLALALLVGAALVHPAFYWPLVGWARGEAFYKGRPSSYWSREMQRRVREAAAATAPVPRESGLLAKFLGWLAGPPLSGPDLYEDPAAMAVLIELLRDPAPLGEPDDGWPSTVGHQVAYNLAEMGPAAWEAVPALAAGLKSPDRATRDVSVRALGQFLFANSDEGQPNHQVGVRAMQEALADEDSGVQAYARHILGQLDLIAAARAERAAAPGR
jgi:HEAT repeat protein